MRPVRLAVIGAGSRGFTYADYVSRHPGEAIVVAVAEPRLLFQQRFAGKHNLTPGQTYTDWQAFLEADVSADAVIIALQDADHVACALAMAKAGYAILCEKPIAPTLAECEEVIAAVRATGVLFAVCHVLRYTPYTVALKGLIDGGRIGQIVSLDQLEPVGNLHQAHSYVRGNWRREDEASPMLIAKSCHDMDWIRYIIGQPCREVSSFGSLTYFTRANQPAEAADRCLDCSLQMSCTYSARTFYLDAIDRGEADWPINVLAAEVTHDSVLEALRTGPYGRCVWACDNDVVDHQVVSMRFENNSTATFTMTAFTHLRPRETRIFGTLGELYGDGRHIRVSDFATGLSETIDVSSDADGAITSGHGGGDDGLMQAFVAAVGSGDGTGLGSDPGQALDGYYMGFAAEQARRDGSVVSVPPNPTASLSAGPSDQDRPFSAMPHSRGRRL